MKIWKKNLLAIGVLVTVCAGIYINWTYSEEQAAGDFTDTLDSGKLLSQDTLVMGDGLEGENTTMTSYFAALRLSRQEARDAAVSLLQEAMAYSQEETPESQEQLDAIVQTALCEAQIESLVLAKGYTDCVAYISDEGITLAVAAPEGGLQAQDAAVLSDIVLSQSDFTLDQLNVVEVQ